MAIALEPRASRDRDDRPGGARGQRDPRAPNRDAPSRPPGGGERDRARARDPQRLTISVQAGDQVFICGINGSGKSRLAMRLANPLDRLLVYEPRGDDPEVVNLPNAARCWGVDAALKALPGRVIYHPTGAEMQDPGKHFDRLVQKIWNLGGRHGIVVMETCDLGDASRGFRPFLSLACRQGRYDP